MARSTLDRGADVSQTTQTPQENTPLTSASGAPIKGEALLALYQPPGRLMSESVDDYVLRTFKTLTTVRGIKIQPTYSKTDVTERALSSVELSRDYGQDLIKICSNDFISLAADAIALAGEKRFYPYITPLGKILDAQRPILSVTANTVLRTTDDLRAGRPGTQIVALTAQSKAVAGELEALEAKSKKTFIGYAAVDLDKGLFAIYYRDNQTSPIKMGLFSVINCPTKADVTPIRGESKEQARWRALSDRIVPNLPEIVSHYFNKATEKK